jgi:DNA primase
MPRIDFRAARAQLRLADVLDLLGFVPRTRHGAQLRGPCPVHCSTTPASRSFAAHLDKGVWHCFGCGQGGNVLDLWAQASGQDVYAAVLDVYRRLGQDVPLLPPVRIPRQQSVSEKLTMPDP